MSFFVRLTMIHLGGGDLDAMKSYNGSETSYLSSHIPLLDIDHRSQTITSEFGSNEDSSSPIEAVKWRRGQLLGKGGFGSVWLALREKVSS